MINVLLFNHEGSEHKGHWNSDKINFGWDQSIPICSDMVFLFRCGDLCRHSVELLEQGNENCCCLSLFRKFHLDIIIFIFISGT